MSKLVASLANRTKQRIIPATVINVLNNRCSVRLSTRGSILTGVPFMGPTPSVGDSVSVDYRNGSPVVLTSEKSTITPVTITATSAPPLSRGASVVMVEQPVSTDHNSLAGMQGGQYGTVSGDEGEETATANEFYHLTEADYQAILELAETYFRIDATNGPITGPVVVEMSEGNIGANPYEFVDAIGNTVFSIDQYGFLVIGSTSGNLPIPTSGLTLVRDGASALISCYSYGQSFAPGLLGIKASGTKETPTAIGDTDPIVRMRGRGFDGTDWSNTQAEVKVTAQGNWTPTSHGTRVTLSATPQNSITMAEGMYFDGTKIAALFPVMVDGLTPSQAVYTDGQKNLVSVDLDALFFPLPAGTPTAGDVPTWDGYQWIFHTPEGGSGSLPEGYNTGDFLRYDDDGFWVVAPEPLELKEIILTPTTEPISTVEGAMYYDAEEKSIMVCVSED